MNNWRNGAFAGTGRLPGRDVCRDIFHSGFTLEWNVSIRDDFTRDDLQNEHHIVLEKREGVFT